MKKNWTRPHSKASSSSVTRKSKTETEQHVSVLLEEAVTGLSIKEDGIYIDATFGRGGHSKEILTKLGVKGRLFGLDKDEQAIESAASIRDGRLLVRQGASSLLLKWMEELELVGKVDGILLDLGVASPQLLNPQRGFSFLREGPLDMRMDQSRGQTAEEWLQQASAEEIKWVLKEYGEERYAGRIATAIVNKRQQQMITTTTELAAIIREAKPHWEQKIDPATRAFQAIRIFINNELEDLTQTLEQALQLLADKGRLVVISFHSLEDRIVKSFIRKYSENKRIPAYIPVKEDEQRGSILLKKVGKAVKASPAEIRRNPRARSAVLRVAERIR